jgi:hypothetical protein
VKKPIGKAQSRSKAKAPVKPKAGSTARPATKAKAKPAAKAKAEPAAKAKTQPAARAAAARGGAGKKPARPAAASKPPAKRAAKQRAVVVAPETPAQRPAAASDSAISRLAGCYVYCIIRTSAPQGFGAIGIGADPSQVRTISYKDLAAVISDTPLDIHDPTRENVLAHERVNETVMRDHTVLPMSFGTVFKTPQDIVELLRSAYDAFNDVLAKMENKVEFGLKILWDPETVIRGIEGQDENLGRLKQEISSQRGSTYFARMQYGRLVDSLLQERSAQMVSEVFEQLRGVAIASRTNKPIGDKMILNAAFLVAREREAEFDARVKALGARHEHVNIRYTGPWPPYNFVNIRLKLERA